MPECAKGSSRFLERAFCVSVDYFVMSEFGEEGSKMGGGENIDDQWIMDNG
jgi:hypothetical protein